MKFKDYIKEHYGEKAFKIVAHVPSSLEMVVNLYIFHEEELLPKERADMDSVDEYLKELGIK